MELDGDLPFSLAKCRGTPGRKLNRVLCQGQSFQIEKLEINEKIIELYICTSVAFKKVTCETPN